MKRNKVKRKPSRPSSLQAKPAWQSESASRTLAFFCRYAGSAFYAREIAEKTGLSAGATNQACRRLAAEGYLVREKRGREFFYSFDYAQAHARMFKVFVTVADLAPLIRRIGPRSSKILMYGSAASGVDGPKSDVDLLVVSDDPAAEKTIQALMQENPRLSIKLKKTSELFALRKKDPSFYENAVLRGLVVYENV